jgi:VanZ family protein
MRLKGFSLFLRRWLPVVLWAAFMLFASTGVGSGDNTDSLLKKFLAWYYPGFPSTLIPEINYFIRKTAHVFQFAIYAVLLWRALLLPPPLKVGTRRVVGWIIGSAIFLAFLSEGIQLLSPPRTPLFTDVALDTAGAIAGCALILGIRRLLKRPLRGAGTAEHG